MTSKSRKSRSNLKMFEVKINISGTERDRDKLAIQVRYEAMYGLSNIVRILLTSDDLWSSKVKVKP